MVRRHWAMVVVAVSAGGALLVSGGAGVARDRDEVAEAVRSQDRAERAAQRAGERAEQRSERAEADRDRSGERDRTEVRDRSGERGGGDDSAAGHDSESKADDHGERDTTDDSRMGEVDDDLIGSAQAIEDIARIEEADHDERGFPVRHAEVVAMDLPDAALAMATQRGFRVIERRRIEAAGHELVRLGTPQGLGPVAARTALRGLAPGATIDVVHYYGLALTAGVKPHRLHGQAGMATPSARPLTVGVIDTAVARHEALGKARLVPWAEGATPGAPQGHGTAVASLIATEGNATIFTANIFRGPPGRPFTSADVIAEALGWMLDQKVPVINMSLSGPRNAILDRLVRDAQGRGQTVVAAAGNGGPGAPPAWPAAVPGVIAVTAVDKDMRIYRHASRGRYISVAALGVDVVAANLPGGFARFTGTSFATPHVAGWLARCRAGGGAADACIASLRKAARDIGPVGFDDTYGFGFVD